MIKFSVLMSVYTKEKPDFLRESLNSVFEQTLRPDEVILVEDGPLTNKLYNTINDFQQKYPSLKTVVLKENVGLGKALNEGMKHCSYDFIARMDSDDICSINRFEKQISFLQNHPNIDMIGCWTQEFTEDGNGTKKYTSIKKFPITNDEIYKFGKRRNPFEHPSVMFKKKAVIKAGGYIHCYLFEDYYLWARMMMNNCKFYNIPEPLLYFRMTENSFERRGGWKYAVTEVKNMWMFKKIGFFSLSLYLKNVFTRFPVRIMPNKLRKFIYNTFLRKY